MIDLGGRGQKGKISTLQAFKNNAKQFHDALQEGQRRGASIVEYSDITGATVRRYWNGSNWVEKKSMLYNGGTGRYRTQGTYKAKYKKIN